MGGPFESNSPFGGYFAPPFAGMGRPPFGCPFRGPSPDHHAQKSAFGPFVWERFDCYPERYCHREPEHRRWEPFEHAQEGCSRREPSECHCCKPHSRGRRQERSCRSPGIVRRHPWFGHNAHQNCYGRRGESKCSECHYRRFSEGCVGSDQFRCDCCHRASCCDQRRSCNDNYCEGRSRQHCKNCCESEPCCGENKEDRESDNSLDKKDSEVASEKDNKIQMVVLWLLRELFWKRLKGHNFSDAQM